MDRSFLLGLSALPLKFLLFPVGILMYIHGRLSKTSPAIRTAMFDASQRHMFNRLDLCCDPHASLFVTFLMKFGCGLICMIYQLQGGGAWFAQSLLAQCIFFDDVVRRVFKDSPSANLVVIAPGFETRALLFAGKSAKCIEIDEPETQKHKVQTLTQNRAPGVDSVKFLPADFARLAKDDKDCGGVPHWLEVLKRAPIDKAQRTVILAENVLRYCETRHDIDKFLRIVGGFKGATLLINVDDSALLDDQACKEVEKLGGQINGFGVKPGEEADWLAPYGIVVLQRLSGSTACQAWLSERGVQLESTESAQPTTQTILECLVASTKES